MWFSHCFLSPVCTLFPACIWWYGYIIIRTEIVVWESRTSTLYSAMGVIFVDTLRVTSECPQQATICLVSVLFVRLLCWPLTGELLNALPVVSYPLHSGPFMYIMGNITYKTPTSWKKLIAFVLLVEINIASICCIL